MKPALVSVFALAIILSSCSSSLPAAAPTGTPATPDATKTATPTRTPSPAPTETPTPTPEYPASCFDQAVIDQVVADFPAKDRGPNGDGVGAGRTVEELRASIIDPISGRESSPSFYPLGFEKGKPDLPARVQFSGSLMGHTRILLKNGNVGLCGLNIDHDGGFWPVLIGEDRDGKFVLAADFILWHTEGNHGERIEQLPTTIEAMEDLLNSKIGRISQFDIVLHWGSVDKIGAEMPNTNGVGMFERDAYFYEMTSAKENGTYKMGMKLSDLLALYIDDDPALLLRRMFFFVP